MKTDLQTIKNSYGIVGNCKDLDEALQVALHVAPTDLSLLILGENGVGKEVFSKLIHEHSRRKKKNFLAINCGSIPPGTINSEFFGHVKGAYTGADTDRKGYFAECNGGTLFLDEIGELPKDTQAMLLRVLESGEYIPVGSDKVLKTDVRIVAATNVDLREAIRNGNFREDLFYRINGVTINIPPLRKRGEDIILLFKKFALDYAEKYGKTDRIVLDDEARQYMLKYPWTGNVRQLRNLVENFTVTITDGVIGVEQLQKALPKETPNLPSHPEEHESYDSERTMIYKCLVQLSTQCKQLKDEVAELRLAIGLDADDTGVSRVASLPLLPLSNTKDVEEYVDPVDTIEELEKDALAASLRRHAGLRRKVAEELGIPERTLYRKIKEYGLEDIK